MMIVIEGVLGADEVQHIRSRLREARWVDGRATAGRRALAVKQNLQVDREDPVGRDLGNALLARLGRLPRFVSASLAERIVPPIFNCYRDGGHYGIHSDAALMAFPGSATSLRTDLSATLFLSSPEEYDGGELQIEGEFAAQSVKLAAGDLVLYPSSSLHQVTPVTRGERICAITWIQSAVADAAARALLFDLDTSVQALSSGRAADDPDIDRLVYVYQNLVRRWARP